MKNFSFLYGLTVISFWLGLSPIAKSQEGECGTIPPDEETAMALPWYNDNQMLYDYLDDQGYYDGGGSGGGGPLVPFKMFGGCGTSHCEPVPYLVPLNIWVYRDNNGNGPTTRNDVRDWLDEVNLLFENAETGIQFYIKSLRFENNTQYYSQIDSDLDMIGMFAAKGFSNSDAPNIHFVRQTRGSKTAGGTAILPHGIAVPYTRYSAYIRTHRLDNNTPRSDLNVYTTFAHELGHVLGLLHTHNPGRFWSQVFNDCNGTISNGCYQEAVSRTRKNKFFNGCFSTGGDLKCEINGDFLCDTAADPKSSGRVNSGCGYDHPTSGDYRTDNWGALWQPPTRNIMAYTRRSCRDEFSEGQIAIMWMILEEWFQTRSGADITGPNRLTCYPGTVTLSAPVMDGVLSYNWTVSSNISIVGGSNSNQVRVRPINGFNSFFGCVTLDVVTRYGSFCMTKELLPALPPPISITSNSPSNLYVCANNAVRFRANLADYSGITNYNWTVSAGTIVSGQGTREITVHTPGPNRQIFVSTWATNACGTTSGFSQFTTTNTINGLACFNNIHPEKANLAAGMGDD